MPNKKKGKEKKHKERNYAVYVECFIYLLQMPLDSILCTFVPFHFHFPTIRQPSTCLSKLGVYPETRIFREPLLISSDFSRSSSCVKTLNGESKIPVF